MNPLFRGMQKRFLLALTIFLMALSVLVVRSFYLQIVKGNAMAEDSSLRRQKTIVIPGMRGKILDAQGKLLAYDEKSFNVEFYREDRSSKSRSDYTQGMILAKQIIEKNGGKVENKFSIQRNDKGKLEFNWGDISKTAAAKREKQWRTSFYFDEKTSLEDMVNTFIDKYSIPKTLDEDTIFTIMGIWQDSILNQYAQKSIVIARGVDYNTAAEIETNSLHLKGMKVVESTNRVYPYGDIAAHILGYMSRISARDTEFYVKGLGYSPDDFIGVFGTERVMEEYLTGNGKQRVGKRLVEVDRKGIVVKELNYTAPKKGDNVVLTIDLDMQMKLEQSLRENIDQIHAEQVKLYNERKQHYDELAAQKGSEIKLAEVGAAIVMDVKTGNVLAMASSPSFDPNKFVNGISQKDFDELINNKKHPLLNYAISSSGTPGSIFKMVTGVAGLSTGVIKLGDEIEDLGEFRKYVDDKHAGPMCWIYKDHHRTHGFVNIVSAIESSCNYFFFTVADRLKIDNLYKWAENFGLTAKTNIELPNEVVGHVSSPDTLYDPTKSIDAQKTGTAKLVQLKIKGLIQQAAKDSHTSIKEDALDATIRSMFSMIDKPLADMRKDIGVMLKGLGINKNIVDSKLKFDITDYLSQIKWTDTETLVTGIGQSKTTLTPIAVARYVSALLNGGYVYDAHIIDKVIDENGKVVSQTVPTVYKNLNIKPEYLQAIKQGMKDVVAGDDRATATKYFNNFPYANQIGGKTGTAQVGNINLENNSWFVGFVPYDKPEIAIVVYIPNGYSGGMSSYTARQVIQFYMDRKLNRQSEPISAANTLSD